LLELLERANMFDDAFVRAYPGAERFCEMSVQVQKNPEIERKILFCQGFARFCHDDACTFSANIMGLKAA